mmetsp:Transcript_27214/g.50821  ORF Transcript_27214/g.50821 Transcript_27214/m.50821 type:complete len:222 (-) Transcript_27214:953-1618(-)
MSGYRAFSPELVASGTTSLATVACGISTAFWSPTSLISPPSPGVATTSASASATTGVAVPPGRFCGKENPSTLPYTMGMSCCAPRPMFGIIIIPAARPWEADAGAVEAVAAATGVASALWVGKNVGTPGRRGGAMDPIDAMEGTANGEPAALAVPVATGLPIACACRARCKIEGIFPVKGIVGGRTAERIGAPPAIAPAAPPLSCFPDPRLRGVRCMAQKP